MFDIIRVNVTDGKVRRSEAGPNYRMLGGRALTSRLVHDEVPAGCHPLGGKNRLVIAPGLLAGTAAPCVNRLSIGAKSPLTGGIKEANCGGVCGYRLARLGIRALVLEGEPDINALNVVVVDDNGVQLDDARDLRSAGNYEFAQTIRERYGQGAASLSIGPAGELRLSASTIASTDVHGHPSRHAARGGLGAVMGSKGIKGVVVTGEGKAPDYHNRSEFSRLARELSARLTETKAGLTKYGTALMVAQANELGGIAVQNYRKGSFDKIEALSGETLHDLIAARGGMTEKACMPGCVIRCSNLFKDERGEYVTSSLEYETIIMLGTNLLIEDLDTVARLDRLCDDIGLDTIETGAALGLAMEGGMLEFGDSEAVTVLLEEVRKGTPAGRLIGTGADAVGRAYGLARVPTVKGQSCVAYDPRTFKGMGVSYATSPMGADHTSGPAIPGRSGFDQSVHYELTEATGQTVLSHDLQIMIAACDSLGWCFFVGPDPTTMALSADMLNALYGASLTSDDVIKLGLDTLKMEKSFNIQAGFTAAHDRLPDFFREEPSPPSGRTFDVPQEELEKTLGF